MNRLDYLDRHLRRQPQLGSHVYIASTAAVIGDVKLGDHASVWFGAVLRGDINEIVVGHHSNVQDNAVLHLSEELGCYLGNWVTVGHAAMLHACVIGDETLIGMSATVLDGAEIGQQCIIGAGTVVPPRMKVPDGSMVLGVPGKIVRALSETERAGLKDWAQRYVTTSGYCLEHRIACGQPLAS